ncbi:superoxide dismutase family protein [Catenuloplanes atrovinosus]|uniref:Cu-Zn family superoxide dismutase n=1 Tax=Catenuloplanes atrovinosus TaxID=137266 RepID=A0AAE4CBE3_9ACTN|nr:superoxide dismutase family protein [Catenuloplanes atrovinosus]MDR7277947.1 Cu-Zn family superoxide dismutase [Catenuloplanes atrovinosus]
MRRALMIGFGLAGLVTAATGCGTDDRDTALPSTPSTASVLRAYAEGGTFAAWAEDQTAITYDPALVPIGASALVTVSPAVVETTVQLDVEGLLPSRAYGAHLHTNVCGPKGEDAGPHYQHHRDPKASASPPSVDPSYANPSNEVWLDFTTDVAGTASVNSRVAWRFNQEAPPRSLVIHAQHTDTAPGRAGTAGPRLACITLPE